MTSIGWVPDLTMRHPEETVRDGGTMWSLEVHPEGYWWRSRKLIHLSSFFSKSHEGGLACFGTWLLREPGMHPAEIERGGREDLLQMDFPLSSVARLP